MIRCAFATLAILIALSSCTPSVTNPAIVTNQSATATSSPLPTTTQTSLPSTTPTASITPLLTIPTFTPTFDVSTILTVTPSAKAECPTIKTDNVSHLNFSTYASGQKYVGHPTIDVILDFLNSGGQIEQLD